MKSIAIIGSRGYPYVYSGYETFVKETFERLSSQYEIHVYCHKYLFERRPTKVNGIHLHYVPAIRGKIFAQLSNSFLSTLHAILFKRYDVILYVNTANGPLGIMTKLFRKKTAIITDGLEWKRPKWKGLGSKYFFWSSKLSTRLFDVLISDSHAMRQIYLELFNIDSVVIEYGANVRAHDDKDEVSRISEFGLEKNEYYLVVGRLVPDNNADAIVKGFEGSNSKRKLVIVGDVPYDDDYASGVKAFASDRVIFTGYVFDQELLKELYYNAYAYIHGHEFGGTNPSLLKALGYGTCVLALDTVFNREVLLDNEYGNYFEKDNHSITRSIESLDANESLVISQKSKSHQRIETYYNWPRIAKEYDNLFTRMIENNLT